MHRNNQQKPHGRGFCITGQKVVTLPIFNISLGCIECTDICGGYVQFILFLLFFVMSIGAYALTPQEIEELRSTLSIENGEETPSRPIIFRFGEHQRAFEWEKELPPPPCLSMDAEATKLCHHVRKAQAIIKKVELGMYRDTVVDQKKRYVVENRREFALIAYSSVFDRYHLVKLDMPITGASGLRFRVKTEGYEVTRLRGTSLNQMTFVVKYGSEQLIVLAAKYLVIPLGEKESSLIKLRFIAQPMVYLATPDELNLKAFAEIGESYVRLHLEEALRSLREKKVPSRAYPGRLVADVVPVDILVRLIVIEQADPFRMFGENLEHFLHDDGEEIVRAVFVRFMLNGLTAFHFICSSQKACGAFQFTNHIGNPGTYDVVRLRYPLAGLDAKYIRGSLSFMNGAQAAACLIDLELSDPALPQFVREVYQRDYRLGGLFPIAAYNGGASQSRALAKLFVGHEREFKRALTLSNIPWVWAPLIQSRNTGGPLKRETAVYLRKYQLVNKFFNAEK